MPWDPPASPALDPASPGAIILPRLFLVLSVSPSGPASCFPLFQRGSCRPSTLCWALWLLFSLPVLSFRGSRPLLRLDPASAASFSLDIVAHSLSPLKAQLQSPLSPQLPSTYRLTPGAPSCPGALSYVPAATVALFCLGSDVHLPRGGTCPVPICGSQSQQGAERGRLGVGLVDQTWTLPLWHRRVPGAVPGASRHSSPSPLGTQEAELGQACSRAGSSPTQTAQAPRSHPALPTPEPELEPQVTASPTLSCSGAGPHPGPPGAPVEGVPL